MTQNTHIFGDIEYYTGPERRHAGEPRRIVNDRRYRIRFEAPISEFRIELRREEDEDGFVEFPSLYEKNKPSTPK